MNRQNASASRHTSSSGGLQTTVHGAYGCDLDAEFDWDESIRAFNDATEWFVRTTRSTKDPWERPGLGEWDLRALVGHTSRSLLTIEAYLNQPAESVEVASAAEYFRRTSELAASPEAAQRGRDAGGALGSDPVAAVATIAERVLGMLSSQDGSTMVATFAGGMRLGDYLPTRTFELAVHTCDLAQATGKPLDLPHTAAAQALAILGDLALSGGDSGWLLMIATGRPVPQGRSVL